MSGLLKRGFVQVYTGQGKGKTTAAWGLALRAVGRGLRVMVVQFLKGQETGEVAVAGRLAPELTVRQVGRPDYKGAVTKEDARLAREGLLFAREALVSGEYDLVVLDEINVAVEMGLIDVAEVLALMEARPEGVELVLTGRRARPEVVAKADLVTEMLLIKHYFEQGVAARQGIEF